ncbi:MAG: magnesium transporter CorA [Sphingobium sp.]|nr:magnesium transporter CorA [Sphingobium sp.]
MPTIAPSVIWAIDFEEGQPHFCAEGTIGCDPGRGEFRWLHLSLADEVTRRWIAGAGALPEDMRDLLLGPEQHQRAQVSGPWLGCVLHDVERDFDGLDTERTGVLRLVLGERIIITARAHPLRAADLVRRHVERDGATVRGPADALDLIISSIIENVEGVARDQGKVIEVLEDDLLDERRGFDHRRLIHLRRRIVQFHRLLSGMRGVFRRMELDEDMPAALAPTVEKLSQQLGAIDGEMLSFQSQLRLLREEADLQATQRTNQNLYLLSILSALLLPATLVTGFFGMNTGGLPLAHSPEGTLIAALLGIAASALVYWLLRGMGLDRRN